MNRERMLQIFTLFSSKVIFLNSALFFFGRPLMDGTPALDSNLYFEASFKDLLIVIWFLLSKHQKHRFNDESSRFRWMDGSFFDLQPEIISTEVQEYYTELYKISKFFNQLQKRELIEKR